MEEVKSGSIPVPDEIVRIDTQCASKTSCVISVLARYDSQ